MSTECLFTEEISELKDEGIDTDVIPWFQNNEN